MQGLIQDFQKGGSILSLEGGPTLGPMLKSLYRGPKGGGGPGPPGSAHVVGDRTNLTIHGGVHNRSRMRACSERPQQEVVNQHREGEVDDEHPDSHHDPFPNVRIRASHERDQHTVTEESQMQCSVGAVW